MKHCTICRERIPFHSPTITCVRCGQQVCPNCGDPVDQLCNDCIAWDEEEAQNLWDSVPTSASLPDADWD